MTTHIAMMVRVIVTRDTLEMDYKAIVTFLKSHPPQLYRTRHANKTRVTTVGHVSTKQMTSTNACVRLVTKGKIAKKKNRKVRLILVHPIHVKMAPLV